MTTVAQLEVEAAVTRVNDMISALTQIRDARDHHAETGKYPDGLLGVDQCFDDWAADLAASVLGEDMP